MGKKLEHQPLENQISLFFLYFFQNFYLEREASMDNRDLSARKPILCPHNRSYILWPRGCLNQ